MSKSDPWVDPGVTKKIKTKCPQNLQIFFLLFFAIDDDEDEQNTAIHRQYSTPWFDYIINPLTNEHFYNHFRISKCSYIRIVQLLYTYSNKFSYPKFNKKFILFISYIAHNSVYRYTRELFSIDHSTIFRKIDYMVNFLFEISIHFIKLPETIEFQELARYFQNSGATPSIILVIDGTQIPINRPKINGENYINRKEFYSINFSAAVDSKKRIRYLSNHLGSAHDSRVLRNSTSLINFMNNLNGDYKIVGDQAYRGYEHIVIPGITRYGEIPNYTEELAKQRLIVEIFLAF